MAYFLHEQAIMRKQYKYNALLIHLQNLGWNTLPLTVTTADIHGIIHQPPNDLLVNLNIPQHKIKNLMKTISLDAIKHLAHIILKQEKTKENTKPHPPCLQKKVCTSSHGHLIELGRSTY